MNRMHERQGDRLPRFFVSADAIRDGCLLLSGDQAQHIKVLRMNPGDSVTVCDGSGFDHLCTISEVTPGGVSLHVQQSLVSSSEPAVRCSVYMAFSKADKFEHVIQKATELGAAEIIAFPSSRCVSRPDAKTLNKKLERWQKIAASAAEQSGRGLIPQVLVMESFQQAVKRAAECDLALFPYENEHTLSLRVAIGDGSAKTVSIVTGPEGGFSPEEVALAQQNHFKICSLGSRILRCETAPLCALTAVLYAAGALD